MTNLRLCIQVLDAEASRLPTSFPHFLPHLIPYILRRALSCSMAASAFILNSSDVLYTLYDNIIRVEVDTYD